MPMAILRIQKLKTFGDIAGAGAHNSRIRETINADPARTTMNERLVGDKRPVVEQFKEKIGDQKIRKNAVLGVEMILSASPEFFRPNAPEQAGSFDKARLEAWTKTNMLWLRKKYGNRLVTVDLHMDEATPHLHILMVPLDDRGKLNCRKEFGGTRDTLRILQTEYASSMSGLGLERGLEGSKAKHQSISRFYRAIHTDFSPIQTTKPKIPPVPEKTLAMKIGFGLSKIVDSDEKRQDYEQAKKDRKAAIRQLDMHTMEAAARTAMLEGKSRLTDSLKKQNDDLKQQNAVLSKTLEEFRRKADQLRGTPLENVLLHYSGVEHKDSKPDHATRMFIMPNSSKIGITGDKWFDNAEQKGGKGAIDLVMHLEGWGQDKYREAVKMLTNMPGGTVRSVINDFRADEKLSREVLAENVKAVNTSELIRKPCERTWQHVKRYLTETRKLDANLIDKLHAEGKVISDGRRNAVFIREGKTGCFKRGSYDPEPPAKPFRQTIGKDGAPFYLPGSDGKLYICESAIDSITLKQMHPESAVIATGGNPVLKSLAGYIEGHQNILLAQDRDRVGDEQAEAIRTAFPHKVMERALPPGRAKDWNQALQWAAENVSQHEKNLGMSR